MQDLFYLSYHHVFLLLFLFLFLPAHSSEITSQVLCVQTVKRKAAEVVESQCIRVWKYVFDRHVSSSQHSDLLTLKFYICFVQKKWYKKKGTKKRYKKTVQKN